jgi:hypothetical protein
MPYHEPLYKQFRPGVPITGFISYGFLVSGSTIFWILYLTDFLIFWILYLTDFSIFWILYLTDFFTGELIFWILYLTDFGPCFPRSISVERYKI